MENSSSDSDCFDESDVNAIHEEYKKDLKSGNLDFEPLKDGEHMSPNEQITKSSHNSQEDIAEKVEGVAAEDNAVSARHLKSDGGGGDIVDNDIDAAIDPSLSDPEDLVRDLESKMVKKKLQPQLRAVILLTATINLGKGIGITVDDLEKNGFGKDNAEKTLRELKRAGYLAELDRRIGHMKQYAMPNYTHVIEAKRKEKEERDEILPNDVSLILARETSKIGDGYHNIGLETALNYNVDYDALRWQIPSALNKQKVATFRLDTIRSCTFTVSPNGTVSIDIECTHSPYFFHTAKGLLDFFTSCGQIFNFLKDSANNRLNVVPRVGNWHLTHFDYNKDLSVKDLEGKYPRVIRWVSKGVLILDYLGTIFQIYCKDMPYVGECLRIEGHYNAGKAKVKVEEMVADIVDWENKHPFTTIEEMLLKGRKDGTDDSISVD